LPSTELALQTLQKVVNAFSTKEFPQVCKKAYLSTKPSNKWSFGNQILMLVSGTADARTYLQWRDAGRYPKKDSKAIYILGPKIIHKKQTDEKGQEETEELLVGFRGIPVFRFEDTDGCPLKETTAKTPPQLAAIAKKWGIKITYGTSSRGEFGSYDIQSDSIHLATDSIVTGFHEMAHAAHARLEKLKPTQDPEQETIAQLSACVLASIYGYDSEIEYTWNYIGSYAEGKTPEMVGKMCLRVLAKVQKILKMILDEVIETAPVITA
jgi:hypothetical protein